MTDAVICYSNPSSVTGKALFEAMQQHEYFSRVRRVRRDKRIRSTDVFVRWGNSTSYNPSGCVEINKASAIRNASNKLRMMQILNEAEGVNTPPLLFLNGSTPRLGELAQYLDSEYKMFIRGTNGIRYDDNPNSSDSYCTKPIDKDREYRVHVFRNEVLGIYEKVPQEEGIRIYKDHNCDFVRCNPDVGRLRCNEDAQAMCVAAVSALGLDFGGVDIIRERETNNFFITEVNSSPSLNSLNINRYIEKFIEVIEGGNNATESESVSAES